MLTMVGNVSNASNGDVSNGNNGSVAVNRVLVLLHDVDGVPLTML